MSIELKVPTVGESITEVEIGEWLKPEGAQVAKDENVVALESEKATVELPAPAAGKLTKILKQKGETAAVGEVIAHLEPSEAPSKTPAAAPEKAPAKPESKSNGNGHNGGQKPKRETAPAMKPPAAREIAPKTSEPVEAPVQATEQKKETENQPAKTKAEPESKTVEAKTSEAPESTPAEPETAETETEKAESKPAPGREEEIIPMSPLRRTVAKRLIEAQNSAALLTTFNEIDMSAVQVLRKQFQPLFQEKYEIKLGIMSFFVKACIDALKTTPQLNAEVRGDKIAYRNYYDIGVAIGSGKGLVVPVLHEADHLSFAEIEKAIHQFAQSAKENKLMPDDLVGGTFTITNGGIYGSLLSTPIVNPPQSGILGLHTIQDRPVAHDGNVVIRQMMYVALTYDHRVVDGREAVTFLKHVKDAIETPARMLLEI